MRALHLCPLWFPVSQDSIGGIETFLTSLIAALEQQGCRNTLLAAGDSQTKAELVAATPANLLELMDEGAAAQYEYYEQHQLLAALELAPDHDVVHSHIGMNGYALSGALSTTTPVLHTQHNPVYADQEWFIRQHPDLWYSTVSEFQARPFRQNHATRCRVIHNGIDINAFTFCDRPGEGLLFVGRMEDEKGPDFAIEAAAELGMGLTLAGPIIDAEFFESRVKPMLRGNIEYVGVVNHVEKNELMGRSACILMPSRVDEGCPIVPLEAMACGTPVVSLDTGAFPEIIDPGVTGYWTRSPEELAPMVEKSLQLERKLVHETARSRFDRAVVAAKYLELYEEMIAA